jgi:hypothetical protein
MRTSDHTSFCFALSTFRGLDKSVSCLTTDWTTEALSLAEAKDLSSSLCVQTSTEAHPASYTVGTGGPFSRGKVQLGCESHHSSPFSDKVKNEKELYLLSR